MNNNFIYKSNTNFGNLCIYYDGYQFNKRTNLVSSGKESCLYKCKNSISLATTVIDGIYGVKEPFVTTNMNLNHKDSCIQLSNEEFEKKNFIINKI